MEDHTRLDIQPVEEHDIVEGTDIGVFELVYFHIRKVEGVAIFFLDLFLHRRIPDAVTVTESQFGISVTFRVVGHSQRGIEEELPDLEVIAEVGVALQVTVEREGILETQFQFV